MPTNDDGKFRRQQTPDTPTESDTPSEGEATTKQRGPYRISDVTRDQEILRDPQVAAFAQAVSRIKDARARAHLEWLVRELARSKKMGER